jgi:hypothetical protein
MPGEQFGGCAAGETNETLQSVLAASEKPFRLAGLDVEAIKKWTVSIRRRSLPVERRNLRLILAEFSSVPPTATQRLKERCGISVTGSLRLNEVQLCLEVCLFGAQEGQIAGVTGLELFLGQIQGNWRHPALSQRHSTRRHPDEVRAMCRPHFETQ